MVVFLPLAPAVPASASTSAGVATQSPSPSPSTVLSPVRFVSTGPGSKIVIDDSFPPNLNVCQANQTTDIKADYPGSLEVGLQSYCSLDLITELNCRRY